MKKLILAAAVVATLAVPAAASADVERHQEKTVEFKVTQPAGAYDQWTNLWTHDYKVKVNPCNDTFTGIGFLSGQDQNGSFADPDETITGKFGNGTVDLRVSRDADGVVYSLNDAPTDGKTITEASLNVWTSAPIRMKVTEPVLKSTSDWKNHGQYVKAMGGGTDAAHSCIGMPINSSK